MIYQTLTYDLVYLLPLQLFLILRLALHDKLLQEPLIVAFSFEIIGVEPRKAKPQLIEDMLRCYLIFARLQEDT